MKPAPLTANDFFSQMNKIILLDAAPLGLISNPTVSPNNNACYRWMRAAVAQGAQVLISEVADYEVRRELIRANKTTGIASLDALKSVIRYAPITTPTMLKAAELWAQARQRGKPTAHPHSLDADVIIAAQVALILADGYDAIVATSNVAHLSLFVPAARWQDII